MSGWPGTLHDPAGAEGAGMLGRLPALTLFHALPQPAALVDADGESILALNAAMSRRLLRGESASESSCATAI